MLDYLIDETRSISRLPRKTAGRTLGVGGLAREGESTGRSKPLAQPAAQSAPGPAAAKVGPLAPVWLVWKGLLPSSHPVTQVTARPPLSPRTCPGFFSPPTSACVARSRQQIPPLGNRTPEKKESTSSLGLRSCPRPHPFNSLGSIHIATRVLLSRDAFSGCHCRLKCNTLHCAFVFLPPKRGCKLEALILSPSLSPSSFEARIAASILLHQAIRHHALSLLVSHRSNTPCRARRFSDANSSRPRSIHRDPPRSNSPSNRRLPLNEPAPRLDQRVPSSQHGDLVATTRSASSWLQLHSSTLRRWW